MAAITLDQFYGKFAAIRDKVELNHLIIAKIGDALSPAMKVGFALTQGRKIPKIPADAPVLYWGDFLRQGKKFRSTYRAKQQKTDPAVILYSGGTTGTTKGILLSNLNFNALARPDYRDKPDVPARGQDAGGHADVPRLRPGRERFTPCSATAASCVLVPRFTPGDLRRSSGASTRRNFVAGVPTLFEALLRLDGMDGARPELPEGRVLRRRLPVRGAEEAVRPVSLYDHQCYDTSARGLRHHRVRHRQLPDAACIWPGRAALAFPFPDTYYKIVKAGTEEEVPYGRGGRDLPGRPDGHAGVMSTIPEETAQHPAASMPTA